jgi:hypothetical protein
MRARGGAWRPISCMANLLSRTTVCKPGQGRALLPLQSVPVCTGGRNNQQVPEASSWAAAGRAANARPATRDEGHAGRMVPHAARAVGRSAAASATSGRCAAYPSQLGCSQAARRLPGWTHRQLHDACCHGRAAGPKRQSHRRVGASLRGGRRRPNRTQRQ